MHSETHTGVAIALAWPGTYCKQPGSWYDPITLSLGINDNHYYKVGHAAVVLIDSDRNECHYFDFGRYHAPFQYGRVRSVETDHELSMSTTPKISAENNSILNFREIVSELQNNTACHGEGDLHASYCQIDFQAAYDKALQMQKESPIPYGPFRIHGSNCSRFVNTVIQAGKPHRKFRFRLKHLRVLTPTPKNNVNSLEHRMIFPDLSREENFCPTKKLDKTLLRSTLTQPERSPGIPENAQWLSGEGAGSWFVYELKNSRIRLTRYSPDGSMECSGLFEVKNDTIDMLPDKSFRITYPSNCKEVSLANKNIILRFVRVENPGMPDPLVSFIHPETTISSFKTHHLI